MVARQFNTDKTDDKKFRQLLQKPQSKVQSVEIAGEYSFGNGATLNRKQQTPDVAPAPATPNEEKEVKKQGRPVEIKDARYQVTRPKKISPALESKLSLLQDYMTEFATTTKRISFDKLVNTLADSYIDTKLGIAKSEHLKSEITTEFEKIQK